MKIGIFGGTYNPPHRGHMTAAVVAANALKLDKLLLIPAGVPPHKQMAEGSASNEDRLAMTRLMADRLSLPIPVAVLDLEMHRPGKSYTSDTLKILKTAFPDDELWLLMGTDMFLTFHLWHEPEVIAQLAGLCAFGRTEQDGEEVFAPQREYLKVKYNARIVTLTLPGLVDVSSTEIRQRLAAGGGEEVLDQSIWGYILSHKLYGTNADLKELSLKQLRAVSYSMVRYSRLHHIRGTEETASKLAWQWGGDMLEARKAAILHDCTKYFTLQQQLSTCEKYGILLDDMEKTTLQLLHSKTAAAIAKHEFGMSDAICEAIRWHTTGKADMTLLEKILYIADYAEPTRRYSWAEELRELTETDLDAAVLRGLEITIEHNTAKGQPIHPKTLEARDWLLAHRKEA